MYGKFGKVLSGFLLFALIAPPTSAAPATAPLGIVVVARQATVGATPAVSGSTIFQGDRLATGKNGQLQVRFGNAQARLFAGSQALVNQAAEGLSADLLSGSIWLSSAGSDTFSLRANHALVRPSSASPAVMARVTRVSPIELLLTSSNGVLEVIYEGEVTTLQAGTTYRMLLDPAAAAPQGPVAGPRAAGRRNRRAIVIAVGVAAATTGIAVASVTSFSASSPVSPSVP
jgi:hypothetical protein